MATQEDNIRTSVSEYLDKAKVRFDIDYLGEKTDEENWAHYAYRVTFHANT